MGAYSGIGYRFPDWRHQSQIIGGIMCLYLGTLFILPNSFQQPYSLRQHKNGRKNLKAFAERLNVKLKSDVVEHYEEQFDVKGEQVQGWAHATMNNNFLMSYESYDI